MLKVPCHNCTERTQWCHGSCERYSAYIKKKAEIKKLIEQHRVEEQQIYYVMNYKFRKR